MFAIERRTALLLRAALRLCLDGPPRRADAVPVLFRHTKNGYLAHARTAEFAVLYSQPGPAGKGVLAFEASALAQFEGKSDEPVRLVRTHPDKAAARWDDGGVPREFVLPVVEPEKVPVPPTLPRSFVPVPSQFLNALHEAGRTTAKDPTRYSIHRVQLSGKEGRVIGTDTRQLLVQGGFTFPFAEDLLVPRTRVFGHPAFRPAEGAELGRTESHVVIKLGPWLFALSIDAEARFPDAGSIVPRAGTPATRLRLHPADAECFLAALGRRLKGPAAQELPVTLDLGPAPCLRFQPDGRVLEVPLARSQASGGTVRLCVPLPRLLRALELGFTEFEVRDPEKPFAARDGERVYLAMPLPAAGALGPSEDAVRVAPAEVRPARPLVPVRKDSPATTAVAVPAAADVAVAAPFDVFTEAEGLKDAVVRAAAHAGRILRWLREVCGRPQVLQAVRGSLHAIADRLPTFKENP